MSSPRPPTSLSRALIRLGWRPEHLGIRLNELARTQGRPERIHVKTPYKWVRGDQPRDPWPALVAALLTAATGEHTEPRDLGWSSDGMECLSAISGLVLPWTGRGGLQAALVVLDAGAMERRMFLTLTGAALTAPAHEWLIARTVENDLSLLGQPAAGRTLSTDVVDHLDALTAGLRRMDDELGGSQLLELVTNHLRVAVHLARDRSYSSSTGKRLHSVIGELLRLAGWVSFDNGHHAMAQRYWVAALHAAHAAGDRGLGANILGFMSCQAKDLGQVREAITLAETARAGYPEASPVVSAILDLRAAEAYATAAEIRECRMAVDGAFDRLSGASSTTDGPAWAYWMTSTHAHGQAGYCYLRLQDWSRARAHFRAALTAQGTAVSREGALRQALMAITYVRQPQPDLDRALHLGSQAVAALRGQVESRRCLGHLATLVDHLVPYARTPAVHQFTQQVHALSRD